MATQKDQLQQGKFQSERWYKNDTLRTVASLGVAALALFTVYKNADIITGAAAEVGHRIGHHESDIVPGVPGQVEGHYYRGSYYDVAIKARRPAQYWLQIEQSPQAVADMIEDGVLDGGSRINPDLGLINEGNVVDTVKVSRETWQNTAQGSIVTFPGDPAHDHLHG